MRKTILAASVWLATSSQALADETRLNGAAIQSTLTDHVFASEDGDRKVEQIFHKSGATFYSVDGAQSQGLWEVRGDQYCSQWPPNQSRACYDVMKDGGSITFLSTSGTRYPMTRIDPSN